MFGIKLRVWGDYACFTRPEMKVERVSYDVMTPSAARGILEAIYWKPAIKWIIDKIHVIKPVKFKNIRRNELKSKMSERAGGVFIEDDHTQRASVILTDVEYIIEAHFDVTGKDDAEPIKHKEMFERRAKKGQCFHHPYFGCREFPVSFELVNGDIPISELKGELDLAYMLYDIDFKNNMQALFFRAKMKDGIIDLTGEPAGSLR